MIKRVVIGLQSVVIKNAFEDARFELDSGAFFTW
jgi:hypothetical protein